MHPCPSDSLLLGWCRLLSNLVCQSLSDIIWQAGAVAAITTPRSPQCFQAMQQQISNSPVRANGSSVLKTQWNYISNSLGIFFISPHMMCCDLLCFDVNCPHLQCLTGFTLRKLNQTNAACVIITFDLICVVVLCYAMACCTSPFIASLCMSMMCMTCIAYYNLLYCARHQPNQPYYNVSYFTRGCFVLFCFETIYFTSLQITLPYLTLLYFALLYITLLYLLIGFALL